LVLFALIAAATSPNPLPLTVTLANSELNGWSADNVVDGDLYTAWQTEPDHLPGLLEFTLGGGEYRVTEFRIAFYEPDAGTQGYTILTSADGGISFSIQTNDTSSSDVWTEVPGDDGPVTDFRIQVNTNSGGDFGAIAEVEAYGFEYTGTTPTTGTTTPTDTGGPTDSGDTGAGTGGGDAGCGGCDGGPGPSIIGFLLLPLLRRRG
jgi:F5/8 type C domain